MERSFLFVPGDRPERFSKALNSGAHAVILDLEDAVKPDHKNDARTAVLDFLSRQAPPVYIRINDVNTPWFHDDLAVCDHRCLSGIILPKSESYADIEQVARRHPTTNIIALIESAQALTALDTIARHPNVSRLMFGTVDFRLDMGLEGDTDSLLYFRSQLVLASKLAGILPPIDGVTLSTKETEPVLTATQYAKGLGFGGKLCIHPSQVSIVNQAYQPSAERIVWAKKVVELAKQHPGSFALDGEMVDTPVVEQAKKILSQVASLESM